LAGGVVALALVLSFATTRGSALLAPPSWLVRQAQQVAASHDDRAPTSAVYCLTTMRDAIAQLGEPAQPLKDPSRPVCVVVLSGEFDDGSASTRTAACSQKGTTIVYVVDACNRSIDEFGLFDGATRPGPERNLTP
jgi:hypothetical protein